MKTEYTAISCTRTTVIFSHLACLCKCFQCSDLLHSHSPVSEHPAGPGVSLDDTAGPQGDRLVLVAPVVRVVGVVGVPTSESCEEHR